MKIKLRAKNCGLLTLIALITFATTITLNAITFTGTSEFRRGLDAQSDNTAAAPYAVELKVNDLIGVGLALRANKNKYLRIDLTGSTFTVIRESAFWDCKNLIAIIIPNSVISIENYTFSECEKLVSIIIPDSITRIGGYAFKDGRSLTRITIPDSVTSIGEWAFTVCPNLASVTIGSGVTSIGKGIFADCDNLTSVTFYGIISPANLDNDAFYSIERRERGDLREKYLAGGIGTYTRLKGGSTWTKQ
jgi:hypothetical protein